MRRKLTLIVIVIFLLVFVLWRAWPNIQSFTAAKFFPTQTSIFQGSAEITSDFVSTLRAPQKNGLINREQAISLAELYCAQTHSDPLENPTDIEAYQITEWEAYEKLDNKKIVDGPLAPVWFVSMNGKWEHYGPAAPDGKNDKPITFNRCRVIMNAKNGDMWTLSN